MEIYELINSGTSLIETYRDTELAIKFENFVAKMQIYNSAIKEIRTKLEILDDEFSIKFAHNPIHHMECRLKKPKSIIDKLEKKGRKTVDELYDIAGVRVICNYIDDIYQIADLLTRQDDITLVRVRDYIKEPKPNGYRSLHLIVKVPIFLAEKTELVPVEIQIRTIAMDFWASLEHQLKYKTTHEISEDLRDELVECAQSIYNLDEQMQRIYKKIQES